MPYQGMTGRIIDSDGIWIYDNNTEDPDIRERPYHGRMILEDFDSTERGSWFNAVLLPTLDENEPYWVTVDAGFNYGVAIYFDDAPLPDVSGIKEAVQEEFWGAIEGLDLILEKRFGIHTN